MTMNPNYLNSPILPGYAYQGQFYPMDSSVQLGYWYNNAFYGSKWIEAGYDFTQSADAYPYCYSQTGYQQLPLGSVPGYSYLQNFYKKYSEAAAYQQQLIQQYNYSQNHPPAPVQNQPGSWMSQTLPSVDPFSNPNGSTIQPIPAVVRQGGFPPRAVPSVKTKKCVICNQDHSDFMVVLGKTCCLKCLKRKYESNELYNGTATNQQLWSCGIIYNVCNALKSRLPSGDQIDPNEPIKLPLDSEICVGRNEETALGYPQYGHITGKNNLCVEDGCPTTEHKLCKECAMQLLKCPMCGEFIKFEEPRVDEYHPECDKTTHCANFDRPCDACHKKATRQKVRPEAAKQEENKAEKPILKQ